MIWVKLYKHCRKDIDGAGVYPMCMGCGSEEKENMTVAFFQQYAYFNPVNYICLCPECKKKLIDSLLKEE